MTKIYTITAYGSKKGIICKAIPAETQSFAVERFLKAYGSRLKILNIKDN